MSAALHDIQQTRARAESLSCIIWSCVRVFFCFDGDMFRVVGPELGSLNDFSRFFPPH